LLEIASRMKMETSTIIQYIIDGIADEINKVILYGAKSISKLKRKFDLYKAMKNKSKDNFKIDKRKKKPLHTENKREDRRYYNCDDKNHLSAACSTKKKGVKCFQCNEYDHIVANCSKLRHQIKNEKL